MAEIPVPDFSVDNPQVGAGGVPPNLVLSYENLDEQVQLWKVALGAVLTQALETRRAPETGGFHAHRRAAKQSHPLALLWEGLLREVDASHERKALALSRESFLLAYACDALRLARDAGFGATFESKLMNANEFASASHELRILADYVALGLNAEVVAVSEVPGERRPDLKLSNQQHDTFIECKCLDNQEEIEGVRWGDIELQLAAAVRKSKQSVEIVIEPSRPLDSSDGFNLVQYVKFRLGELKSETSAPEGIRIDLTHLGPADRWIFDPAHFPFNQMQGSPRGHFEGEPDFGDNGIVTKVRKVCSVKISPYFNINKTATILRAIKSAAEQLPVEYPGIIHIHISATNGANFMKVADLAHPHIETMLRRASLSHVVAVVLSAISAEMPVPGNEIPIGKYYSVIPNAAAPNKLPSSLKIVGAGDTMEDMWGFKTIVLEFSIPPEGDSYGQHFINLATHGCEYQFKFWRAFEGEIRLDFVTPVLGRTTLKLKSPSIDHLIAHAVAVTFDDAGATAYFDGVQLT